MEVFTSVRIVVLVKDTEEEDHGREDEQDQNILHMHTIFNKSYLTNQDLKCPNF